MKRYLSFVLAASLSLSAITSSVVFAEGTESTEKTAPTVNNMVVFGDSIASGHGLNESEYTYAQICADYLGCNLDSFTADDMSTAKLLSSLQNPTDVQKEAIVNTDVVVISVGANDMIHVGAKRAIEFAAKKGLLAEGYTVDDIPEDPGIYAMTHMIDQKAFRKYADSGIAASAALNTELKAFSMDMRLTEGNNAYGENQGIIKNKIMTNIDESIKAIRAINPDAQIIVQTLYQPFQLSPEYIDKTYGKDSGYASMLTMLREDLNDVMVSFREELAEVQKTEDFEVVDILQTFTALDDINDTCDATPGYAYYFTDMQKPVENEEENGKTMNFNPNKNGHLAIATQILSKIKVKDTETGELVAPAPAEREVDPETGEEKPSLITQVVESIDDIADCPPTVMEQVVDKLPESKLVIGDVNNDGLVDSVDASLILSEYANLSSNADGVEVIPELDEEASKRADINGNGNIESVDASLALAYYAYTATLDENTTPTYMFAFVQQLQAEDNN